MKKLEGLHWQQRYITQLGCIKGCLDYLGREVSFPWLYGGTGYAFVLNIQETLDPSGPTCWDTRPLFDLAPNLGYKVSGFSIEKAEAGDTYPAKQRQAWDFVRACLDRNLPCYGWELQPYIPDYYIINGYEEDGEDGSGGGYLYSGWMSGGPLDWRRLGEIDVQVLQVYCVELHDLAPDRKVVQDALSTVIQRSATPAGWFSSPGYATGPAAYDLWAHSLETGQAIRDGHSYNAATWLECREMAVEFLKEAQRRLPGLCDDAFVEAAGQYTIVCDHLRAVLVLNPFQSETWDNETKLQSPKAASMLRLAGTAERKGLEILRLIVDKL
jgi:hypothetical protein